MPKLRQVSGSDLVTFFKSQGFSVVGQRGSHIKLRRIVSERKQTLIVPQHDQVRVGTVREICKQASQYISEQILQDFFYTK